MTQQDYIDYVRTEMAADYVTLECEGSLDKILNQSLGELREYITYNKFVTVPYQNCIDLSAYNIRSIIQVYRTEAQDSVVGTAGSTDALLLTMSMVTGGSMAYDTSSYTNLLLARKLKNTIATDLDYRWDDPYLWIVQNPMQSGNVTIEYTPVIKNVEEITDDYWIGKLKKLFLANTKIVTGRIRSKYKVTNALYINDGDAILAEGQQEKQAVMDFLQQNGDLFLPIGS